MNIEVLYFDGCPSHARLLPALRDLAAEHGAELEQRHIRTPEQAEEARFLGSPSVRIDGVDVEPGAERRTDFGLKCRLYRSSEGQAGLPPRDWIERALGEAAGR
ncbi:MAG: hypothetical protein QOF83_3175 [Solirubrobacteraceae bacterium]|jgi:hypothetical protein|nr:hypothetical protein [Solirubrobacteraceae bacterium]